MPDVLVLAVREIVHATPRSRILRLSLGDRRFTYRAGQAVMIGRHGQTLRKPYSLAAAPEQADRDKTLELLVQVGSTGSAGSHLDGAEAGTPIDVEGPLGSFYFPPSFSESNLLFIAGGTGIAPLRAMLWHVLMTTPEVRIGVLYSARTPDEFAYIEELQHLAGGDRIKLQRTVTRSGADDWAEGRGRLGLDQLGAMIPSPETLCFLCGPPALLRHAEPLLRQLGIAERRIRMERWEKSGN
ncbi:MAG: hypothetical protein HYZ58_16710 [Acidobacteria bacterium]|nr:hypothetical protein [Acidobacteriota bacterium]